MWFTPAVIPQQVIFSTVGLRQTKKAFQSLLGCTVANMFNQERSVLIRELIKSKVCREKIEFLFN